MHSPNHGHVSVCDGRHRSSKRVCDEADSRMGVEARGVRCAPPMLQLSSPAN
jgi:hypothetical protein